MDFPGENLGAGPTLGPMPVATPLSLSRDCFASHFFAGAGDTGYRPIGSWVLEIDAGLLHGWSQGTVMLNARTAAIQLQHL